MSFSLWFALLISSGLISLCQGDARQTAKDIEQLYNEVLQSSLQNARERLYHLNDSNAIDKQYFHELDTIVGTENYYSTAYFIFALINRSLFNQRESDKLLLEVLPYEKISIRNFFSKVKIELLNYLASTHQNKFELMTNVTRWQTETEDTLVISYLGFPQRLQDQVPELQLMDYMKQAKSLVDGIVQSLTNI
ncbi:uncharacterized protein LOC6567149 [Drosophila grimshawi]|uniref:GH13035 n=1 Tax=Drosophila grimshawi TaxID=7222 RepID=B4JR89_DROGR|nr:uncharacterized protein LOC6567149 [Drosophila grimshawi]EDV99419.1 GH13035 [Drosophila grimshawi]